jgi:hypothetical protein
MHRRQFRNNIIKNSVLINLRFYLQGMRMCVYVYVYARTCRYVCLL